MAREEGIPKFLPRPTGQVNAVSFGAEFGYPKEAGLSLPVSVLTRRYMVTYYQGLRWVVPISFRQNNLRWRGKITKNSLRSYIMVREQGDRIPGSMSSASPSGTVIRCSKASRNGTI